MDAEFDSIQLSSSQRIAEPAAHPNEKSHQTQVGIAGVTNQTVLSYMNYLGANNFDVLIELLAPDGALQPLIKGDSIMLYQHFVVLRDRALIIYCADSVELEKTLDCLGYVSYGLNMIVDRVVLEAPDFAPIIHCDGALLPHPG